MTCTSRTSSPARPARVLLVAALAALAACGPVNRGLESVHQPVVRQTDHVLDLRAPLSGSEANRLAGWLAALDLRYGDRVSIDDRADGGARATITRIVAQHGLGLEQAPIAAAASPDGIIRVVVRRATASLPGCPDWRRPSHPELANSTMSNFGCAMNANLSVMVADPNDLVAGKQGDGPDAQLTNRAIKGWRDAPPVPPRDLSKESTGGIGEGGSQ